MYNPRAHDGFRINQPSRCLQFWMNFSSVSVSLYGSRLLRNFCAILPRQDIGVGIILKCSENMHKLEFFSMRLNLQPLALRGCRINQPTRCLQVEWIFHSLLIRTNKCRTFATNKENINRASMRYHCKARNHFRN